jgi:hypothetical protein
MMPREMGFPLRSCIAYSMDDMLSRVNQWNGKCDIFSSLYSLGSVLTGRQDYDTYAQITHMFFDLDNHGGNAYNNVNKLHDYLVEKNYLHCINFSGDGFHVYVAVQYPNHLKNKRVAIDNAMTSIANDIGLKIGIHDDDDIDARTVGNVSQLVRIPNTYNPKRKRFCIPLEKDEVKFPIERIRELAKYQRFDAGDKWFCGEELINLQEYDGFEKIRNITPMSIDTEDTIGVENIDVEAFKPCIKALLKRGNKLSHGERYIIITFLREEGIPIKDTIELLRKYLPSENFYHCIKVEKQPQLIYGRADLVFPSCNKLQQEGYCFGKSCLFKM